MLLGRGLWLTADHEGALAAYHEAVRLIPSEPPSAERAHVLAGEAQALMLRGRSTDALAVCEEALGLAREVGDRYAEARILNTMAGVGWSAGVPFENAWEALSIAREIVDAHGGTIGLKSELGKGSQFTLVLPLKL